MKTLKIARDVDPDGERRQLAITALNAALLSAIDNWGGKGQWSSYLSVVLKRELRKEAKELHDPVGWGKHASSVVQDDASREESDTTPIYDRRSTSPWSGRLGIEEAEIIEKLEEEALFEALSGSGVGSPPSGPEAEATEEMHEQASWEGLLELEHDRVPAEEEVWSGTVDEWFEVHSAFLPPEQWEAYAMYHGLNGHRELSPTQIGHLQGISRQAAFKRVKLARQKFAEWAERRPLPGF